jgi:hypothetical protein
MLKYSSTKGKGNLICCCLDARCGLPLHEKSSFPGFIHRSEVFLNKDGRNREEKVILTHQNIVSLWCQKVFVVLPLDALARIRLTSLRPTAT